MPATTPRVEHGRASADWLALREPADAAARSDLLLPDLRSLLERSPHLLAGTPLVVHDLGSGTGSQRRWLAPRLAAGEQARPQCWVEHDRDAALLAAPAPQAARSESGAVLEVRSCGCELAELTAEHLSPADLVTASALLDVLTAPAVDRVVGAAERLRVPLLLSLSVVGRVRLTPADPLDGGLLAAFNDHQRRSTAAGRLLGPDAVAYAIQRLVDNGATVRTASSPWLLGGSTGALTAAWFTGWLAAAVEQEPALAPRASGYRARRLAEIAAGRLEAVVEHADLLAWWP